LETGLDGISICSLTDPNEQGPGIEASWRAELLGVKPRSYESFQDDRARDHTPN
jgi:hypothetical protein